MSTEALPRVLCVDDEPNVLEGLTRTLRRHYHVTTAVGPLEGLDRIRQDAPYQVVVSDLRMPVMDGVAFLSRVRQLSPDTSRILLTGQGDMQSASAAVNEGAVFRFLLKPCQPDALHAALTAAVAQNHLVTSERVLLEQTLHGSIKALTDILGLVNPAAFGRAARLKNIVAILVTACKVEPRWPIEVAAMLSQIGAVTLSNDTAEKYYRGDKLSHAESLGVERLPNLATEVVANIPRMDEVRRILSQQSLRFDGIGTPAGKPSGVELPFGARALKLATDLDVLETQGFTMLVALNTLRGREGWYDPSLLTVLMEMNGTKGDGDRVVEVEVRALRVGMIFAEDVKSATGILLIARGQEVTDRLVDRLRNFAHMTQLKQQVRVILPAVAPPGSVTVDRLQVSAA